MSAQHHSHQAHHQHPAGHHKQHHQTQRPDSSGASRFGQQAQTQAQQQQHNQQQQQHDEDEQMLGMSPDIGFVHPNTSVMHTPNGPAMLGARYSGPQTPGFSPVNALRQQNLWSSEEPLTMMPTTPAVVTSSDQS
jgi:hypothetical protein